ncbi:hypothetical protein ACQP00_32130 [Dactylosporangium sp. CS-047395]
MAHLIDMVLGLPAWLVYAVVAALAFGESAAWSRSSRCAGPGGA